jgi:predicted nucleic acid-binding protein
MARIFWDSMLFIYLFQSDPIFGERVANLRQKTLERGDELCTSHLALGEVLAGAYRDKSFKEAGMIKDGFVRAGIKLLPFESEAADLFGRIRAAHKTSAPDSIHLACAAAAGVDLFITGDKKLTKLNIPGITFLVDIDTKMF